MIKRVDHISFAVKNLEEAVKKCERLYGGKFILEKVNEKGQYRVAIVQVGENLFSFLESTHPEGFVAKHIEKFGESIQHMGVEVDNLDEAVKTLAAEEVKVSNFEEVEGVRREALVSPRHGFGVVLQLMEWLGDFKNASQEERMQKAWRV
ncbi:hypothetical protein SY88_15540 [Clostridiales bacterium PH28_bin88]|nr:hypothetical protein SY88_15540 [Clostridiales bacterium PH28_bin88]